MNPPTIALPKAVHEEVERNRARHAADLFLILWVLAFACVPLYTYDYERAHFLPDLIGAIVSSVLCVLFLRLWAGARRVANR